MKERIFHKAGKLAVIAEWSECKMGRVVEEGEQRGKSFHITLDTQLSHHKGR